MQISVRYLSLAAVLLLFLTVGLTVSAQKRDLTGTTWEQTNFKKENTLQDDEQLKGFGVATRLVLDLDQGEPDKPARARSQLFRVDNDSLIRELASEGTYDGVNLVLVHTITKADYGADGTETLRLTLVEKKDEPAQLQGKLEVVMTGSNSAPAFYDLVFEERDSRLPVIFLPGVAGSVLNSRGNELWPTASMGSRADLALESDGVTSAQKANIEVGDVLRRPDSDFYGGFLESLKAIGYKPGTDLFTFPYDWRMSNDAHHARLEAVIRDALERSKKKKVILIAHSMGGVIARSYVFSSPERASKVASMITMGTPFWGAPKVFYALTSGYQFGNPTVRQELMKILLQNYPSAYQLLPQRPFIDDKKVGQPLSLEASNAIRYKWFSQVLFGLRDQYSETAANEISFNGPLLKQASSFFSPVGSIGAPRALPGGVQLYAIIGTGVSTLNGYDMQDWTPGSLPAWLVSNSYLELGDGRKVVMHPVVSEGDGTVPLWSLEPGVPATKYYVRHSSSESSVHSQLPANPTVQAIVAGILKNKPLKTAEYGPPRSWLGEPLDKLTEDEDNAQFELHSDAHLRITGPAGKALGLSADGVLDERLAGTFMAYEGAEFASISDLSTPVSVSVDGIRTGKFNLDVKIRMAGKQVSEFAFRDVPVIAGTKTEFTFVPGAMSDLPSLTVKNGNVATTVSAVLIGGSRSTGGQSGVAGFAGEIGPDGTFTSTIPAVGGTVTSFRFFTGDGDTPPPQGMRDYQARFPKASLKAVYYELSVKYAAESPATFKLVSTWSLNQSPFARQDLEVAKPADWNTSTKAYGYGNREPGKRAAGKYTVTIEVDGRKVAAGSFIVY